MPQALDPERIPRHVAVIMDGNGRWAKRKGLPRIFGHRAGTKTVKDVVKAASEIGIEVLTLYTFSTENWSRAKTEVSALMNLLSLTLRRETDDLDRNGVRLGVIGRTRELPKKVKEELEKAVERLKGNKGLKLNLAFNYGGRQEIVDAVNRLIADGVKKVDEAVLAGYLYTDGLPDPDLVIRTSGEQRISNFLIYQSAYAEFVVTPTLWPDFKKQDLIEAVLEYQNRDRRFGGH